MSIEKDPLGITSDIRNIEMRSIKKVGRADVNNKEPITVGDKINVLRESILNKPKALPSEFHEPGFPDDLQLPMTGKKGTENAEHPETFQPFKEVRSSSPFPPEFRTDKVRKFALGGSPTDSSAKEIMASIKDKSQKKTPVSPEETRIDDSEGFFGLPKSTMEDFPKEGAIASDKSSKATPVPVVEKRKVFTSTEKKEEMTLGFTKQLGQGKAKNIFLPPPGVESVQGKSMAGNVLMTPVQPNKADEIRQEMETAMKIKERYAKKNKGNTPNNIAWNLDKLESPTGDLVVIAEKAEGDLEKFLQKKDLTTEQRIQLAQGVVNAMDQLHSVGAVAGDLKPENFLVFKNDKGELEVKLSDLGKTRLAKLDDKGEIVKDKAGNPVFEKVKKAFWKKIIPENANEGNTRFGPADGKLSFPGEIEGLQGILIRIFEEPLPTGVISLLTGTGYEKERVPPAAIRRGFEHYKVDNKAFNAIETSAWDPNAKKLRSIGSDKFRRMKMLRNTGELQLREEAEQRKKYIDALGSRIKGRLDENEVTGVISLLMKMNSWNSSERINAKGAADEFREIFAPRAEKEKFKNKIFEDLTKNENLEI